MEANENSPILLMMLPIARDRIVRLLAAHGVGSVCEAGGSLRSFMESRPELRLIVVDMELADRSWRDVLEEASAANPGVGVVVYTRTSNPGLWCEALERGAYDVLHADNGDESVMNILAHALAHAERAAGGAPDRSAPESGEA